MPSITLIVHNIRSTHNVGSIFRTAEGFGVEQIILSGYTPYPTLPGDTRLPHEARKTTSQIHKTALGAETMVNFVRVESLESWFSSNDKADRPLPVYALEQAPRAINLRQFVPADRFALLLGEEVNGIKSTYIERCNEVLEIPMSGQKESFNVSVATGIALYHLSA